jgi:hypothetical protein
MAGNTETAATQAAEDVGHALDALEVVWGDVCTLGYDSEKGFWAARNGRIGALLTADDSDGLLMLLDEDYGAGR